jgi:PAS domain S-box-containing protein
MKEKDSLQDKPELFSDLLSITSDFVAKTDTNGRIESINKAAIDISGYDKTEIIGKEFFHFVAPEDRQKAIEDAKLIFERRMRPKEYHLEMKDGAFRN